MPGFRTLWFNSLVISLWFGIVVAAFGTPVNIKTYIPKNAYSLLPMVKEQRAQYFLELKEPEYMAGLIEQESCISLTHKRCWSQTSELRTARELGIGLGQLTVAYKKDGSVRFDALKDLRNQHMAELRELSWSNITLRPDLQIRSIVLMSRDNYLRLFAVKDTKARLDFTDAAYNGGLNGVVKERQVCSLRKGCNAQVWFGNVENVCLKSKKALYGDRSACDINREHVQLVRVRMPKYKPYFY